MDSQSASEVESRTVIEFLSSIKGLVKMLRLDVINSLMTVVFLMIVSVLALVPETDLIAAIGGILGIVATVLTIGDAALIYRKLMFNPSGPFEKKHSHDKKRRSRHSRHSHHSHHSYEPQPSLEKK
ncbi:chemokine-like factor isoform X2 [Trichosurus vulpecula]|uniref:chemokine-like factor isoform X2 n=1 Tax=Trichosurus vulpecula TaxID=9337 RepID=UPI00186B46CF|nr:chemokine-like factor isoform X2 [Trichosurus vulpecula]